MSSCELKASEDDLDGGIALKKLRRYRCAHSNCDKSYTKPSRLAEHERSHTGERPYACSTCNKSYLRESHLQAHTRTHLSVTDRPFECEEYSCEKRFWTVQHLRAHISSVHKREKPFRCTENGCDEAFAKHRHLRKHVSDAHSPPGTKPYRCEEEGCTKSFATNQKLRKHSITHEDKRYACIDTKCTSRAMSSYESIYFPNWTALQAHIREQHPPTCHYPECDGRTFASQKGLRGHLKVHEEREIEEALEKADGLDSRPKKRRRGGEVGRDWACQMDDCLKTFKSKTALTTHHNITHLGRRDHVCSHGDCGQTFGYKHLLQRHTAKAHAPPEGLKPTPAPAQGEDTPTSNIDWITGRNYTLPSSHRNTRQALIPCPWPDCFESQCEGEGVVHRWRCEYLFSRAYDLRRHLKADHGFEISKEETDAWVKSRRQRSSSLERVLGSTLL